MLLNVPCRFSEFIDSNTDQPFDGNRLGNVAVTTGPSANTMGSWTALLGATAQDAYGIEIWISLAHTANAIRSILMDIGADPAGGTNYSVLIPALLAHGISSTLTEGPHRYFFPLFIPAGTSLAAQAQTGHSAALSPQVRALLYCKPSNPEAWRCGSYVDVFGASYATSVGTAVAAGTTSEGSWTQLGSNTTRPLWFWQVGANSNSTGLSDNAVDVDIALGDSTNKDVIAPANVACSGTSETLSFSIKRNGIRYAPSGTGVYARAQAFTTGSLGYAVYGVGG
jgi:hypothetical protein